MKALGKAHIVTLAVFLVLGLAGYSNAMMGIPGTTTGTPTGTTGTTGTPMGTTGTTGTPMGTTGTTGTTTGTFGPGMMGTGGFGSMGSYMMTNSGSFGMMNGLAGAPIVGDDGTAYMINFNPTTTAGTTPSSNSFESNIVGVTPSGQAMSVTLKGIASRPVVEGNVMVATASLPDLSNYSLMGNYSSNVAGSQSVIYIMQLPLTSSTVPQAVAMDGAFASVPVVANNHVYVTTTDYGNGMFAGNGTFASMFGNYNFNSTGTATTYMYIFNMDGSLLSKTTIQ